MEVTGTFVALLSEFQCVFTAPSFATFVRLMAGWVLTHRRRLRCPRGRLLLARLLPALPSVLFEQRQELYLVLRRRAEVVQHQRAQDLRFDGFPEPTTGALASLEERF